MNKLLDLFPPNYKNLEQPAAIKLLEDIEKVVEEQERKTIKTKWFKTATVFGFKIIVCKLSKECKTNG